MGGTKVITSIYVDGFRSLVRFHLSLRPGLNLLIGPNGSGKTNIISFLGFLADTVRFDLSQAVSNLGGSGAVFRKRGEKKYHSQIKARIQGKAKPDLAYLEATKTSARSDTVPDNRTLYYEYSFTTQLSDDRESVFFARQTLRLHIGHLVSDDFRQINTWDADVQLVGNADGSVSCTRAELTDSMLEELRPYRAPVDFSAQEEIAKKFVADDSLAFLIWDLVPRAMGVSVFDDFGKGMIFNPHPSRIRLPEDSAKNPGIRPDGSGLYASILALKRGRRITPSSYRFMRYRPLEVPFHPSIKLDRLLEFFRLAYPAMTSLTVTNDQFENTIRVRVALEGRDKSQIPLAALSDGTLKWMAFVTAVFTNPSILAIEEPENFVHPFAQREAVRLAREQLPEQSFLLMSSHSETILNSAEPEEVVVVTLNRGRTVAKRVRNPVRLRELIDKSGFGLGFYYLSGALSDA